MSQFLIFCCLQACNSLTMMGLSLITPFFPPFADDKGVGLITLGFIISANPIGNLIASLVLGKSITEKNRFYFIITGMLIQGLGLFSYVILFWIQDLWLFILVAAVGRGIGGVGTAFFMTPFFAYIPLLFPDQIEKKIAEAEFVSGLSQLVGPVFGSLLYGLGGYITPFLVFGCLDLALLPILVIVLLKSQKEKQILEKEQLLLDQQIQEQMDISNMSILPQPKQISYIKAMLQYQVMMQFLMVFICNVCFTYFQPIIAIFYEDQFEIKGDNVGYLMSLVTAGYTLGTFCLAGVTKSKRLMVFLGCLVLGGSYLFIGPSEFTGLDHHLYITLISQFIMGLGTPPVYLPSIPLLNEILASLYPAQKLEIANISSAIFTSGMSIGQLVGPIISGFVTQEVGFENSCAYLGLFIIGSGIVYLPMIFIKLDDHKEEEDKIIMIIQNKLSAGLSYDVATTESDRVFTSVRMTKFQNPELS